MTRSLHSTPPLAQPDPSANFIQKKPTRRGLLKGAGVAAVAAGVMETGVAQAETDGPAPIPIRSAHGVQIHGVNGPDALPSLGIIVLNRLAFGPRPGELAAFNALGSTDTARLTAWVDQQLAPASIDDSACDAILAAQNFVSLHKSLTQLWLDYNVNRIDDRYRPLYETDAATWLRAVYSKRQLNEVLADFWHNHFNIHGRQNLTGPTFVHWDRDVMRGHMLGNFRQMLEAVATAPAMLYFLDNYINSRSGPNENWARELFELHTLGAENYRGPGRQADVPGYSSGQPVGYVDDDVYEATRSFTGWRINDSTSLGNTGEFYYDESWHDRFQKTVLGKYIAPDQQALRDGRDVLDVLAAHPGTGRYIARKLCRRLISDSPPEALIQQAAALFTAQKDAPDQLTQVVRLILLSDGFRAAWGQKIKRPYEVTAGALRAVNATFVPSSSFLTRYDDMGQELFRWPAPDGFPDVKDAWGGSVPMVYRWRFINYLMENGITSVSVDVVTQTPATTRTPNALADFWISRILGRGMEGPGRAQIVELLARGRNADYDLTAEQIADRLPRTVAVILMAPDFQWR
ncbi:MAG: DUF1800 domain-containing protein [Caldilineaceae bacterium]|nr:DUF1800 domain-containing protein [Caldilineaceae bacterium]